MVTCLRITKWNANDLQRHEEGIKVFLTQNFIDVSLISDTHCTNKNHRSMPRYKLYYTSHPDGTAHRVTTILIKETIEQFELYGEGSNQTTSIKVKGLPY
jgi:exonuclease III